MKQFGNWMKQINVCMKEFCYITTVYKYITKRKFDEVKVYRRITKV